MRFVPIAVATAVLLNSLVAAEELVPLDYVAAGTPFAAVGRVHPGAGTYCTGALVARNRAITAAHCLYDHRTERWADPASVHFLLGYDRGAYGFHSRAVSYETGGIDPSRMEQTMQGDWALILLEKEAPSEYPHLETERPPYTSGRTFELVGFAAPRRYALSKVSGCRFWEMDGFLASPCAAAAGMSGAPLINTQTGELVGIQIAILNSNERQLSIALPASRWDARP